MQKAKNSKPLIGKVWVIRVIQKVMKTQNQNLEFGHTQGEF